MEDGGAATKNEREIQTSNQKSVSRYSLIALSDHSHNQVQALDTGSFSVLRSQKASCPCRYPYMNKDKRKRVVGLYQKLAGLCFVDLTLELEPYTEMLKRGF